MKKILTLLVICSFTLLNSCEQSNSQLFDLVLEIKSQNDQLLNEVKTLQLKSDLLISELRASAAKQEELLVKVTELQGQLSTILSQIDALNQQLKTQDADVQLIKNQLAGLQTQYQGIFKQLEELQKLSQILAEIEKMKTQISQLDSRYVTILSGVVQNKQLLDALKTQISSIQTQLAENLTKIAQLTSQLGDQGVVIGDVLKQIELLKTSNAELVKQLESLINNSGSNVAPIGSLTDIDGNVYKTVKIGNQIWMAENLKTAKFSNGDLIPNVVDRFVWEWFQWSPTNTNTFRTTPAYSYYNNDEGVNKVYGKLYNWYVVSDSRNVCPTGWRVSTDQDWTILESFIGQNPGDKLKKTGTDEWNFPNSNATNEFGFSALPGGLRNNEGFFNGIGSDAVFWAVSGSLAYYRTINSTDPKLYRSTRSKTNGLCIRCIKN
ncbi:FISUMP domain-containing protein [Daejeonella sp.]|uniref:FISUMP domain-containing protein n=1 Tax=Daejeonella sp. TaxID=2805397 RepID=UPI0025B913A1|nr:FISUMP domain-containing protein [Daejeonella sp.]